MDKGQVAWERRGDSCEMVVESGRIKPRNSNWLVANRLVVGKIRIKAGR